MSTPSSSAEPQSGRELDALFKSGPSVPSAARSISPDLAALLDNEVVAISTGKQSPVVQAPARSLSSGVQPPWPAGGAGSGASLDDVPLDAIDVPPPPGSAVALAAAQPPVTGSASLSGSPSQLPPAGAIRPLPANTQRIGAIVVETTGQGGGTDVALATTRSALAPASATDIGPVQTVSFAAMPSPRQLTPEQRAAILANIPVEWLKSLHEKISGLYEQVPVKYANPPANAEEMLQALRDARQALVETPEEYVNAEFRIREVEAMINRTAESRADGHKYGYRILAYELVWAVLLLIGLALAAPLTNGISQIGAISGPAAENLFPFWGTMMWGGLGGVVGALYMLWWHVSRLQDFDGQHSMWYLVQPIMGMVLGGIMFLIMAGGLLIVQVDLASPQASAGARLLPYLLAVLAGFRQNFVYEQFDRLIALFTSGGSNQQSTGGKG